MKSISCGPRLSDPNNIRGFYLLELDQQSEQNTGIVADDGCYELMFVKENNITLVSPGSNYRSPVPNAYSVNLIWSPFHFEIKQTFSTFCIKLQPWVNAKYIPQGLPKGVIQLKTIFGPSVMKLQQQIFEAKDMDEKVCLSERYLNQLQLEDLPQQELVKTVCERIHQLKGNITVQRLAEEMGTTRQRLSRVFKFCVKYPLKQFIIQIRIRSAIEYKIQNSDISLTSIAHMFGYFDQAHFVKDFKKIVGVTPSSFVNELSYSCNSVRRRMASSR